VRRAALIALLALAASACTIDVNVGITLDTTGSGSVSVDIAADEEFLQLHQFTNREFEDLIASRGAALGLAFTVTPGDTTLYSARSAVVSAKDIAAILEGLAPGIGTISITTSPEALVFDAPLNPLTTIDDLFPYFEGQDPAQFGDNVNVTVSLEMPGEIASSTGLLDGNGRPTWTIPFSDAGSRVFARSVLEKEGRVLPWTIAIVGTTIVLAVGFLITIRSNLPKSEEPGPATPAAQPPSRSRPPEKQKVGPDATPPEDQPVAPPAGSG